MRSLTLFGRNVLINSLLNSLFMYNAKIESPPKEFVRIIENKNKKFLWEGGVAKIAHHSLIGDYKQGGIRYKDIDSMIQAQNIKSLLRINTTSTLNSTCVPRLWLMSFFQIPLSEGDSEEGDFQKFFSNNMNLLDCKLKVPKKRNWKGHPSYLEGILNFENLTDDYPRSFESLLSIPLWFNKMQGTTFQKELSNSGYTFIHDMYYYGKNSCIDITDRNAMQILKLKNEISPFIKRILDSNADKVSVIYPFQAIRVQSQDKILHQMKTKELYRSLISQKVRIPRGLLNWCLDLELSDSQIQTALTFTAKCSLSIFDRVFQYKINTNTLPTNEYLYRYKVKDSSLCDRCLVECDNIIHRLYECETVASKLDKIFKFILRECNFKSNISQIDYLFGKKGNDYLALNHALLELKKMLFYSSNELIDSPSFIEIYLKRIRSLMIKEKSINLKNNNMGAYETKWNNYVAIYDFRGPDLQLGLT